MLLMRFVEFLISQSRMFFCIQKVSTHHHNPWDPSQTLPRAVCFMGYCQVRICHSAFSKCYVNHQLNHPSQLLHTCDTHTAAQDPYQNDLHHSSENEGLVLFLVSFCLGQRIISSLHFVLQYWSWSLSLQFFSVYFWITYNFTYFICSYIFILT